MPYSEDTQASWNSGADAATNSDSGSSWWDTVVDGIGKAADWYGRNEKAIGAVVNAGRGIYNAWDAANTRKDTRSSIAGMYESLMQKEMDYANQMRAYQEQQLAQQSANANARAQAAAATDRNRRAAAKKALAVQKKMLKQLQEGYAPYVEAAKVITPKATQNYTQFLDTTSLLNQYLTPMVMKGLADPLKPSSSYAPSQAPAQLSQSGNSTFDPQLLQKLLGGQ